MRSASSAQKIGLAFIMVVGGWLAFYSLFSPAFATNDDWGMLLRLQGKVVVDAPDIWLVYQHPLLAYLLSSLYQLMGGIPWYPLHLIIGLAVAHIVWMWLALENLGIKKALIGFGLYMGLMGFPLLLQLQFSITAALLVGAGLSLWARAQHPQEPKIPWPMLLLALLLWSWGALIRWESALLMSGIFLPGWLLSQGVIFSRPSRPLVIAMLGLGLCALAVKGSFLSLYAGQPSGQELLSYNVVRSRLMDDQLLEHLSEEKRSAVLASVGWTENEYQLLIRSFFPDQALFGEPKLRSLVAAAETAPMPWPDWKEVRLFASIWVSGMAKGLWLLVLLIAWQVKWNQAAWKRLGSWGALALILLTYLWLFHKFPPARISEPIWVCLLGWSLLGPDSATTPRPLSPLWGKALLTVALLFIAYDFPSFYRQHQQHSTQQQVAREICQSLDTQTIYLSWPGLLPVERLSPFASPTLYQDLRICELGTQQLSPAVQGSWQRWGLIPFGETLAQGEAWLWIIEADNRPMLELLRRFSQRHFHQDLDYRLVKEVGDLQWYQIKAAHVPSL
ncbi:MAG: hypothetical protein AAFP92_29785 [Bacteroidota bacterium]